MADLLPCVVCGRTFAVGRHGAHQKVCIEAARVAELKASPGRSPTGRFSGGDGSPRGQHPPPPRGARGRPQGSRRELPSSESSSGGGGGSSGSSGVPSEEALLATLMADHDNLLRALGIRLEAIRTASAVYDRDGVDALEAWLGDRNDWLLTGDIVAALQRSPPGEE